MSQLCVRHHHRALVGTMLSGVPGHSPGLLLPLLSSLSWASPSPNLALPAVSDPQPSTWHRHWAPCAPLQPRPCSKPGLYIPGF